MGHEAYNKFATAVKEEMPLLNREQQLEILTIVVTAMNAQNANQPKTFEMTNEEKLALFEKFNYFKDSDISYAISFLDEIIYSNADDELKSEACCDKALFLKDYEDFDRILEYFDDGLSFNSNNTRIYYLKGCFYSEIGFIRWAN